ncbi:MAG: DUF1501 domain-containing protein [Rhodospirillaceae bacterium]
MLPRRVLIRLLGAAAAAAPMTAFVPFALANAATDRRLVVVLLRGALDGLAAVPPYADPDYAAVRGALALPAPGAADGALDLDGRYGLHPALAPLHAFYRAQELLVVHAVASPYRSRSHFDGQDLLESGGATPHGRRDGWLNRALGLMGGGDRRLGLAVGNGVPLILRGATPVGSWAPQAMPAADGGFLEQVALLYRGDPVLGPAIGAGIAAQRMTGEVLGGSGPMPSGRPRAGRDPALEAAAEAVGRLLADPRGPRVAALDVGGWDTHAGQGAATGRLAGRLGALAAGIDILKAGLGPAWRQTVVAIVTEFGRTAAPNGTGGTDHGTASVAFLAGGAVAGGRVVARWPGLTPDRLFEGRDLAPTMDMRAVLKGVLTAHLGVGKRETDSVIFPDSAGIRPFEPLLRA